MRIYEVPQPSDTSVSPGVPPPPPPPPKRFGKKIYIAIGLIAVVAVASVLAVVYFLPKILQPGGGLGESVPLELNYNVGENMTYQMNIQMNYMGYTQETNGTISMKILSFDGQVYTIRYSAQIQGSPAYSYTMKINKNGAVTDFGDMPSEMQQMYYSFACIPGYGSYFPKSEIRIGENWQIPLNVITNFFTMHGTINYKAKEIQNHTVQAGKYNSLKAEVTADNIQMAIQSGSTTMNFNVDMNGYFYLEKDTCNLIEFSLQETITGSFMGQTVTMTMTMEMELVQHTGR